MITTDFIEMEMDDATLHVKKGLQGQLWTFMPGDSGTAQQNMHNLVICKKLHIFFFEFAEKPPKIKVKHMKGIW